jgi:hypothetical protein
MQRGDDFIIRVYSRLLRLYPQRFRAEFADEMLDVFALACEEAQHQGRMATLGLVVGELQDLPLSVMREHVRERRNRQEDILEVGMMLLPNAVERTRFCARSLLVIFAAYCFFVLIPFFTLGVHLMPTEFVYSGSVYSAAYPLYDPSKPPGSYFYLIAIFMLVISPVFMMIFGGLLAVSLPRAWKYLRQSQRLLGSAALIASLSILLFTFSTLGRNAFLWLLD